MTTFWKVILVASLCLNFFQMLMLGIFIGKETARKELEKMTNEAFREAMGLKKKDDK
jgi:hypothetical protein